MTKTDSMNVLAKAFSDGLTPSQFNRLRKYVSSGMTVLCGPTYFQYYCRAGRA